MWPLLDKTEEFCSQIMHLGAVRLASGLDSGIWEDHSIKGYMILTTFDSLVFGFLSLQKILKTELSFAFMG